MDRDPSFPSRFTDLPWLADLVPEAVTEVVARAGSDPPALALAMTSRSIGCRRDLARELGRGEALGIDMVHGAVNELLARRALPHLAALHVAVPRDSEFAAAVTEGIVRACRAHAVPMVVPLAADVAGTERVGLVLVGAVVGAPMSAPAAGDVVLALRSTGPTDGDFATLQARIEELGIGPGDHLASGDAVGATLVAARNSHFSVVQQPLRERWPARLLAVDERSLVGTLRAALQDGVDVEWDFAAWQPPAPFAEWFPVRDRAHRAASASSFGCGMLVLAAKEQAARWLHLSGAWNEPATPIGRIVAI